MPYPERVQLSTDEEIRAHPAYPDAVQAAKWMVASISIGLPTVLFGAYMTWRDHDSVVFFCVPVLLFSQSLQFVRFKRDHNAVNAIGDDSRRVRKLAERDAFRLLLGFGRDL